MSPAPPAPAKANDSLSTEKGGTETDDLSTSDLGGGGVVDELDDGLAHLNDLDVAWGFDVDAFMQERIHQVPADGEAGIDKPGTMGSFQGGAMDVSSALRGKAETAETMGSSQGGAVDASSVPAGRAEGSPSAASGSDTGQGKGEGPPAILSGWPGHGFSSWGRLSPTVRGRTRG